ncbi:MAG: hypothetical protein IPP32_08430 [Bacteroidetes bacterium]|nr:hypothetical protein [Bacteroidota bacterium]
MLSFFTLILSQTARAQYCVFSLGGGYCFTNDILSGVEIAGTTLVNYNNGCTLTTGSDSYSNFPASGTTTATVTWGQTYTLKVVSTSNSIISFWIDYNHNYVFDASEWKQIANGCAPGLVLTVNFTVPYGIYIGKTKMRIRSRAYGNPNNSSSACTHFATGETEDYTLTITGPLCTSPPNAGQVLPTLSALCQGTVDTFKLKSNDHGYGLTYQWQVSPASLNWSNIAGAVDTVLVQTVLAASYYRCIVTCSGVSDTTAPVFVWVKPNNLCYCLSNATSSIRTDIGYVRFSNLQNGTDTSKYNNPTANKTYSDYTYLPPADVMVSASYTMRVNQISGSSNYSVSDIYAYIDFNHDTVYNTTTERFHIGSTFAPGGETVSGFITIPATALTGITGMRIILKEGGPSPQNPCGTYNNGETEDYLINIQGPSPCISPPIGGITNATESYACAGSVVSFYLQGNSIGIGQTFQWQFSSDGINWISKPGATLASYSDSIFSSMYYRCLLICNSDSAYSSSKHIALNPITQCNYCNSTAQFNTDSDIGYFSLGSLINGTDTTARNNPTSTKMYSDFTTLPAPNLPRNSSHIIDLIQINKTSFFIACYAKVYIDYNQDGFFNNSDEMIDIGQTNSGPGGNRLTKAITIPATALLGNTRMRIVLRQYGSISPSPCGTYNYGETEDYTVNIVPNIPPCTSPTGGSILASDSIVCPGTLVFFTLQGNSTGSGQIYQWQSSSNNINWASILGANSESYSDTINVGAYYRCSILCNGQLTYSTVQSISMDTINPCYCQSNANYVLYNDIGYVSISTLQNGTDTSTFNNSTANNSYTDFTNLPATNLIQGQNYTIRIIQINNSITLFQSYAQHFILILMKMVILIHLMRTFQLD